MNDQDRLTEIKARREALIDAPWQQREGFVWGTNRGFPHSIKQTLVLGPQSRAPQAAAEFIAHAPDDITYLLGEVEQARRDRDDMHQNVMRLQDKVGFAIEREQKALAEVERLRVENRRARANLEAHVSIASAEQEIEDAKFLGQGDVTVQEMRRQIVDRWLAIPLPDET